MKKLATGWVLFLAGILLEVVSDIADIWIIGVLAGILWPVGMVMGINALLLLKHKKQMTQDTGDGTEDRTGNS